MCANAAAGEHRGGSCGTSTTASAARDAWCIFKLCHVVSFSDMFSSVECALVRRLVGRCAGGERGTEYCIQIPSSARTRRGRCRISRRLCRRLSSSRCLERSSSGSRSGRPVPLCEGSFCAAVSSVILVFFEVSGHTWFVRAEFSFCAV
jgi:hypothetical protein